MSKYLKNVHSSCYLGAKQTGYSLIEILVSALILSVGVLGVASLQVVGLKGTQQSYTKQQAMSVVQNLTERMRSNKEAVLAGNYVLTGVDTIACDEVKTCGGAASDCSAEDLATADKFELVCGYKVGTGSRTGAIKNENADDISTFIDGDLIISCTNGVDNCATGNMTIQLNWSERPFGEEVTVEDSLIFNTNISL